jgi:solute carrier family 50 protein (sugar transporter)
MEPFPIIETTIDAKLARLGELTTLVTLISPLPAFVSCHKSNLEKTVMLEKISFNFLMAMFVTNMVWLAYSIKIENNDLIVINALGSIIAGTFVSLYIMIQIKAHDIAFGKPYLIILGGGLAFAWLLSAPDFLLGTWWNGFASTSLSMTQYLFTLDGVKAVLTTKDPTKVNLTVAIACMFNSYAWGCYAILTKDPFVLIPNIAGFCTGFLQLYLYLWTTGSCSDMDNFIKCLHKYCGDPRQKVLPRKLKTENELDFE